MIKIFSKKLLMRQEKSCQTDLHSHLIPGIDDGVKTMDEALNIIEGFVDLGFKRLIITPHIMSHRYPNNIEIIYQGLMQLRDAVAEKGYPIKLDAASEYYLDEHFLHLVENREVLTFSENHVLFEMSYINKPLQLEQAIKTIQLSGYKPVLAHPERYQFMSKKKEYQDLKEWGVLFQVNLNSFSGFYGEDAQKAAHLLMKNRWIDYIGSDTHKIKHFESYKKNYLEGMMQKILNTNPILNNSIS